MLLESENLSWIPPMITSVIFDVCHDFTKIANDAISFKFTVQIRSSGLSVIKYCVPSDS